MLESNQFAWRIYLGKITNAAATTALPPIFIQDMPLTLLAAVSYHGFLTVVFSLDNKS